MDIKPKKGGAVIFFPGFMNGELDTDALHAGMPAVDTKWVSQVWLRQSFREDGQPSQPVRVGPPPDNEDVEATETYLPEPQSEPMDTEPPASSGSWAL